MTKTKYRVRILMGDMIKIVYTYAVSVKQAAHNVQYNYPRAYIDNVRKEN